MSDARASGDGGGVGARPRQGAAAVRISAAMVMTIVDGIERFARRPGGDDTYGVVDDEGPGHVTAVRDAVADGADVRGAGEKPVIGAGE